MTQPEQNVRLRRTQTLLRNALIALIEEQGFDALTVGELTERAMVSRATFYRLYQDKYDLVERIFDEAMSPLLAAIGELGTAHPAETWVKFFEHIAAYQRMYRALLGRNGSPWFVWKMRAALQDLIMELGRLPHGQNHPARQAHTFSDSLAPDLVATLLVEAISWWLEHDTPFPPKEIASRTALLVAALFKEADSWR